MTTFPRQTFRPGRRAAAILAMAVACGSLVACSSTTGGGASGSAADASAADGPAEAATADQVAATIRNAFLADVDPESLDPTVRETLKVAAVPLTPEQQELLTTCLAQTTCETGRGTLTVAFANDTTNAYRNIYRAEFTAQAIAYPSVKTIIYSNANNSVSAVNANLRSLIAQRVDAIVINSNYAASIVPALQQAQQAGIAVIEAGNPVPENVSELVTSVFEPDLCGAWADAGNQLADNVTDGGSYAMYTGIAGNPNAAVWQPCLDTAMTGRGWTQAESGLTEWTPQGTAQAASALIASGRNPAAIAYDYSPEDFVKPYIDQNITPPAVLSGGAVNYSWLNTFEEAQAANLNPRGYLVNSQVWYGRIGVTAALKSLAGEDVAAAVTVAQPVVPVDSVLPLNVEGTPASAPVGGLLTVPQMTTALAAG
ncbi:hypothetical protein CH253_18560 [Rhodococcus sp. 06-156-3C]|uniref:substrate-binding domain-containing protein n=1 Tax=Nocardiaceae TaxID=85025 RepID=UPI00052307AF|nr:MULTISPECIES: substrate-binding domain-containing protein [Rhodococcus]OZD13066.1 hypothetical protein CH248_27760 [Rhodococcus sp. 06-156-4a]OZD17935.1 hypothetical protein CH253_18560 [Rhodococcus sp. 06-156-3C]OZD20659.1 hypothetical protein CH280_03715 [Rhodococcus sp. 06-156-4C]OZD30623.1 hypothetical protein CH247_15015 [Rhodococcus sp. 06-156-3b]OZD32605.1 hypothetical protein CH284_20245 [Rhodococcus sp. 06-156-3]